MSAQGTVPSESPARALIAAVVIGLAIGAGTIALVGPRFLPAEERPHRSARAASPNGTRMASAFERMCGDIVCGELRIGTPNQEASAKVFDTYRDSTCDEIVWTPDGKRVGFLMTGQQLVLYDAETLKHLGNVRLLTQEAASSRRARGVTFSENGRALTFDDCPRTHSGCRAGVVGVPQ
jgi:hypothetical protein